MTVAEMLARISAAELTDWLAYEAETGPLDPRHRGDVQAGIVASTIANAMSGKKGRRHKPDDFVPDWGRHGRRQTGEEMLAQVVQINRAMGGEDRRQNP